DRRQPESLAIAPHHAEHQLGRTGELLHRISDIAPVASLGPGEQSVTDPKRAFLASLDNAQSRRLCLGVPLLWHRPDGAALIHSLNAKHRDLRNPAGLVEGAARRTIDQSLVGHVLQQSLEIDLGLSRKTECPRDLALAGRPARRRNEVEDLLAAGESFGALLRHQIVIARCGTRRQAGFDEHAARRSNPEEEWFHAT